MRVPMFPPAPKTAIVVCIVSVSFLVYRLRLAPSYGFKKVHLTGLTALKDKLQTIQGCPRGMNPTNRHRGREGSLHLERLDAQTPRSVAGGVPAGDGGSPDVCFLQNPP